MITVLNVARLLMVLWIAYGLLLIFAPGIVHSRPNATSGAIQAILAFAIGYLLDRALSLVLRRKAASSVSEEERRQLPPRSRASIDSSKQL